MIYEQYISCYSALQSDYIFKNFTLSTFSQLIYVFSLFFVTQKTIQNKTKQIKQSMLNDTVQACKSLGKSCN